MSTGYPHVSTPGDVRVDGSMARCTRPMAPDGARSGRPMAPARRLSRAPASPRLDQARASWTGARTGARSGSVRPGPAQSARPTWSRPTGFGPNFRVRFRFLPRNLTEQVPGRPRGASGRRLRFLGRNRIMNRHNENYLSPLKFPGDFPGPRGTFPLGLGISGT